MAHRSGYKTTNDARLIPRDPVCAESLCSCTLRNSQKSLRLHLSQDMLDGSAVQGGNAVLQQRAQRHDAGDGRELLRLRAPAEQRPQH